RTWVRVAHLRNRERETSPAVGARRAQPLPAGDSDGPPGPGGPEVAAAGACRGRLPVPGLALSAARRLLHHACLPYSRAATSARACPFADVHRDSVLLLALH